MEMASNHLKRSAVDDDALELSPNTKIRNLAITRSHDEAAAIADKGAAGESKARHRIDMMTPNRLTDSFVLVEHARSVK
jgi:hypothetical protein